MKLSEFKPTEEVLERVHKCTTAEEVEKLAREYDVELTAEEISEILKYNSLKELNDEQLDLVAGGEDEDYSFLPDDRGIAIGKYEAEAYIGREVYIAYARSKQYLGGTLVRSWENSNGWFPGSQRFHSIFVKCSSPKPVINFGNGGGYYIDEYNKEYWIDGDFHQLFLKL